MLCAQPRLPGLLLSSRPTRRIYCVHFDRSLSDFWLSLSSTSLAGITVGSSRWDVLKAFLTASDGAIVSRLRELATGLLFIASIPGRPHSGAIYFYSSVRRAVFMLDWAGRDDDFEAEEFDVLVEAFSLDLTLAPGACPATRHHSRRPGGRDMIALGPGEQDWPRRPSESDSNKSDSNTSKAMIYITHKGGQPMFTRTTPTSGWEPTASKPRLLPVAPGLAKTYMKLFVNRLSYCEQSPYGDHRYHRPKHPELKLLAGRRAAMEMPGQKWGSLPHVERANEIYLELVKERRLPSPYRSLTEKIVEQHFSGEITINLYAIDPEHNAANGMQ